MFKTLLKVFFSLLILISCSNNSVNKLSMSDFGKAPNGEVVKKFKLTNSNGLSIEVSKGESIRCGAYCNVAQFCNQYKEELANG